MRRPCASAPAHRDFQPETPSRPERLKWFCDAEKFTIRLIYDREPQGQNPLTGNLAAYVAFLHLCGPEALGDDPPRPIEVDAWTVWHSGGVTLHLAASLALVIQQRRHDWRFSHL